MKTKLKQRTTKEHTGKRRKTQEGAEIERKTTEIERKLNGNEWKRKENAGKKQDYERKRGKCGTVLYNNEGHAGGCRKYAVNIIP